MDGLLIDTETIYDIAWLETFHHFNIENGPEVIPQMTGMSDATSRAFLNQTYRDDTLYDKLLPHCNDLFWELIETRGIDLKEGAQDLLDELSKNGVKTVLATSTSKMRALRLLEISGLRYDFEFMCYGNMVTHSKPHPEMYELVVTLSNLPKEEIVVLEDSINGVLSCNAAQLDVIWIPEKEYPVVPEGFHYYKKFNSLVEAKNTILAIIPE